MSKSDGSNSFRFQDIRMLKYFIVFTMGITVLYSIKAFVIGSNFIYVDLAGFAVLGIAFYFYRREQYRVAASIYTWGLMVAIVATNVLRPEIVSPALLWPVMFPVVSVALAGIFQGVIQTIVMVTILTVVAYAKHFYGASFLPVTIVDDLFPDFVVNMILVPFGATGFAAIFHFHKVKTIKALDQSLVEKKSLLSILFHDFSNIITTLDGQIQLSILEDKRKNGVPSARMEKAQMAVTRMVDLLTQIRELEAYRDGKVPFALVPTNLKDLCERLEVIFAEQLAEKNIKLDYSEVSDRLVLAEPISLLNCVLSNLVSNSIKFSDDDGVVKIFSKVENGKMVIFCKDHGVGISKSKLKFLFSINKKTSSYGTRGERGTGYGLPIAKEIMQLHGGDLEIVSKSEGDDRGTVATIVLDVAA